MPQEYVDADGVIHSSGEAVQALAVPDSTTEVSPFNQVGYIPSLNLAATIQIGRILARSKFFPGATQESQAIAKILAGQELGIPAVASLMGFDVIKGRIAPNSHLIAALIVKSKRYRYKVQKWTHERCELLFLMKDEEQWLELGPSEFTLDDAKLAGLLDKPGPWKDYPRNMLFSRALTNGARIYCPDIFIGGVYTVEELGGEVSEPFVVESEEDGEIEFLDL